MGEVFAGRYELVDPIGRGGVGAVWRTWDHRRRRYVAAKVLQQRDAHALLRFVREQAVRIDHPHVLAPASWAADDDKVLFTMDLVAGGSLVNLVNDYGPLPPSYVCNLLDQLLSGLAAVHAEGVIHRDIKPANVLLEATGTARPRLRLSDFGIAMRLGEPRLTETNYVVGTPGYFAPEQMLGADPDFPADLFAVGLVALYLLEGAKPDAKALIEHFAAHGTPKAPRGIPEPLWQVIATLLQPDPNSRFRTATGARKALAAAVELLPEPGPDDELVEVFDQLGPLPTGFTPEGPLHRASGLDTTGTSTGTASGTDATPPPPHHPPTYGPPPMGPPSQPGKGPALPAQLPGAAPQPPYTATGSISPPPMPTTAPPQTDSSSSGNTSGIGSGNRAGNGSGFGAGPTDTDPRTGSGVGTGPGTGHWPRDPGPASSTSSAHSGQPSPEPPSSAVPPRPERAPAPLRPSTMSDTGSFHLPPPQVLTADAPSRQVEQHAPGPGHPQQQPEQQASTSTPAGTAPVRTAPAQHPEPAHVPSPQAHPPLGPSQAPASAVQQHAYASTGSYTARPSQVPRRSRALPRRRPGPPVKVVVPVLLLALACFAVGFWALSRL
ncbi:MULTISPECIES: serine/threonine-protein kinase [unclassified Streptomyces]|uniref:serine/threonine-protein kinase n=1 Tax=unclassified Streptomyces TaxID=2593676 RepID=UPI002E7A36B1|nr:MULTISPECIES: protein kinase [unclassified Streptomyces]MEE1763141.1 protein kinase [Streptomyces sp. SP18BB07]MEE1837332.1 protein kinase [Streptomyces sp. SP17KL33]